MNTAVDKARRQPLWRLMHRAADRQAPVFRRTFLEGVRRLRSVVLEGLPVSELEMLVDRTEVIKADPLPAATEAYARVISGTVLSMVDYVEAELGAPAAAIAGRFDVVSPSVVRFAETLAADLVREVNEETKTAIRRIVAEGVRTGMAPREQARLIRQTVGLTSQQAGSVVRFRAGLLESGMSPSRVDRLTERLANRKLRDRAESIARTETMRASNRGQQSLWQELQRQGILSPGFQQRWLVTPDDRLCPRCSSMSGQIVAVGGFYRESELQQTTTESPPLHPRCRCVTVAVVDEV